MLRAWYRRSMGFISILLLPFMADAAWQQKFLPGAKAAEALCFDGSEPVMYTQKASTETSNWIVYFEAGGFCATVEDCSRKFEENKFLFSSNFEAELGAFQGLNTFADSILNPFRTYNKLYVAYCSQDLWVGNQEVVRDGTVQARFQGYNIVRQVMRWLNNTELQPSSTLVMQGSSAGGFAVFNHLNWISQNVKHRDLKGVIDSSWISNIDNAMGMFELNQLTNVSTCLETWGGDAPCCTQLSCMALSHDFPPVNVPVFIIGHTYDFYLTVQVMDSETFRRPLDLMRYGERYNQEVITVSNAWKAAGKQVVLFISDCLVHSGFVTSSRSVLTAYECGGDNIEFSFAHREGYYECNLDAWPNDAQGIAYYDDAFKIHSFSWSDTWERLHVGNVSMQRALMDWSQSQTPGIHLYTAVDNEPFGELSFQSQWCPTKLDQLVSFDTSLWDSMQIIGWILVCMIWLASLISLLMVYFVEMKIMKGFEDGLCLSEGQDATNEITNSVNDYALTATARENTDIVLAFERISLSVKDNKILKDVSGQMESGSVYAVMGGSGSGKTTLLNVLALRCKIGDLTGIVRCNGQDMDDFDSCFSYAKSIGFVTQYGLPPNSHLPVMECLYFSAIEKMPTHTVHERAGRAAALLQAFKLKDRAHVPVESLSGGQQRRLLVCIELLKNPPIIFLDEPTSGLDATGALELVRICNQVAHSMGKLIIMTIHQPSFEAFQLLDKLVLLHKGKLVFLGDREEAIEEILPETHGGGNGKASLNIADDLLSALPGFAEANVHDQTFKYVDADKFRFLEKATLPKFSVRLRVFTSSRWYSYRLLDVILLTVVIPLIVVVFLGLVNLGETPLQEVVGTLMFLLSLPMTQLLPMLNATIEKRLWPVLQRCKNVEVKGTAWFFSWILTDFTVMMMSMVLAALIGSGIGLGEHYRAEDYRVVALVAACYMGSMSTIYMCFCILFAPMVKDDSDLKKIVAILVGLIIFAGSAYGGLMWRTDNLPAPYQWLAFACPGTWSQLTVLISLFADRDLGHSSMCAQMGTFAVPDGFCTGNLVLEYFSVRKFTYIPEFFVVYSFGLMFFLMCISIFKLEFTFRGHLRVLEKHAVEIAKTPKTPNTPQVLTPASAINPEQAEDSCYETSL